MATEKKEPAKKEPEKKAPEKKEPEKSEPVIKQTRTEARAAGRLTEPKPEKVWHEADRQMVNGLRSVKIARKEIVPGLGTRSTLVARLAMKNGKWQPVGGRVLSKETRKACKDAGIEI